MDQHIQKIVDNFDEYLKLNEKEYSKPETEAVWFYTSDHGGSYEVDMEWLGVTRDGKIAWAYASGCSCWGGEFEEKTCDTITMKEFVFNHDDMKADWEQKLKAFAEKI